MTKPHEILLPDLRPVFIGGHVVGFFKMFVKKVLVGNAYILADSLNRLFCIGQQTSGNFEPLFHLKLFKRFAGLFF